MVTPKSSYFNRVFPLFSPSILGYPDFWKHPRGVTKTNTVRLVVVSNVFGIFTLIPGEMIQYVSNGLVKNYHLAFRLVLWDTCFFPFCPNLGKIQVDELISRVLPGTPEDMGPPYGKRDPYYSHIFRDSYGVPENPIDYCSFLEMA